MNQFFEIKALPDPEIIQSTILGFLMDSVHKNIVQLQTGKGQVGVAFPCYGQHRSLGGIIRLIGEKAYLEELHELVCADSIFEDYALATVIQPVPEEIVGHCEYRRIHPKGNSHFRRLKKRQQARGSWNEEAEAEIEQKFLQPLGLPHVYLQSKSTDQKYPLFVKAFFHKTPKKGTFNCYGLSLSGATVPSF